MKANVIRYRTSVPQGTPFDSMIIFEVLFSPRAMERRYA